jgi:hypothetical protein
LPASTPASSARRGSPSAWASRPAGRRVLGSALRGQPALRHRLHHEPVHRPAGLSRSGAPGRGQGGRAGRFVPFGACRRWTADDRQAPAAGLGLNDLTPVIITSASAAPLSAPTVLSWEAIAAFPPRGGNTKAGQVGALFLQAFRQGGPADPAHVRDGRKKHAPASLPRPPLSSLAMANDVRPARPER